MRVGVHLREGFEQVINSLRLDEAADKENRYPLAVER